MPTGLRRAADEVLPDEERLSDEPFLGSHRPVRARTPGQSCGCSSSAGRWRPSPGAGWRPVTDLAGPLHGSEVMAPVMS